MRRAISPSSIHRDSLSRRGNRFGRRARGNTADTENADFQRRIERALLVQLPEMLLHARARVFADRGASYFSAISGAEASK